MLPALPALLAFSSGDMLPPGGLVVLPAGAPRGAPAPVAVVTYDVTQDPVGTFNFVWSLLTSTGSITSLSGRGVNESDTEVYGPVADSGTMSFDVLSTPIQPYRFFGTATGPGGSDTQTLYLDWTGVSLTVSDVPP